MTGDCLWMSPVGGRKVLRLTEPSAKTVDLLTETVWGSRASRYRIIGIAEKLRRLRDPCYFVLLEGDLEVSVVILDRCQRWVFGEPCDSFHFMMAATAPGYRNRGLAGILIDQVRRYAVETLGRPSLGFAYVEATTEFSLRLSDRIGHAIEASFPLTAFTRIAPRDDPRVKRADEGDLPALAERLSTFYSDHQLTDFHKSLNQNEYFVLQEGAEAIAGAQAELLRWSVVEMPGLPGRTLMSVLPRVPFLNRAVNLKDLRVLRLGNLLCPPGTELALSRLIEALLARHDSSIGLILMDARSPVLQRILRHVRLGTLAKAFSGSVTMRVDVVGMEAATLDRLTATPLMMSPADVI